MIIMFIGIVLIFLQAIKMSSGQGFLEWILLYIGYNFSSTGVAAIILIIVVILLIWFITAGKKEKSAERSNFNTDGLEGWDVSVF